MKSLAVLSVCVLLLLVMLSCSDSPDSFVTSSDFVYPIAVGNRWVYQRTFSISNVRPDSLRSRWPDSSSTSSAVIEVTGTVTLRDSVKASVFHEAIEEGARTQVSDAYYANRDSGLYILAYRGPGNIIPKGSPRGRFLFHGIYFNDVRDITSYIAQSPPLHYSFLDSLIYEDPPLLSLKYPVSIGSEWTFRPPGRPWRIDKRILRREIVEVPAGSYNCFVIQWLYPAVMWGNNILFLDYVAEIGLIKRSIQIKDIAIAEEEGPGQIGLFDNKDESILIRVGF